MADDAAVSSETVEPIAGKAIGDAGWRTWANRPALRRAVQIGIIGLIALFFARALAADWPQVVAYQWQVQPGYCALAALLLLCRAPVQVLGWKTLLARLGHPLRWRMAFRIYFQSALARYLPGGVWFAVGRVLLAEQAGVPRQATAVSVAVEQVLNTVAALLVSALALAALPGVAFWPYVVVLAGLGAFMVWPRPVFAALDWGLARLGRSPVAVRLRGIDLLVALLPFLANWLWYGAASFCWTAAVVPTLTLSAFPLLTGLYIASWVVGFLALGVPNGWGVREGLLIAGLHTVLGLALPAAGAAAILSRLGSILSDAFWGAVVSRLK